MAKRLEAGLKELHEKLRKKMIDKWNRSLPFEDELFDRWERAKFLGFGKGSSVYQSSHIFGNVKVGKNTWIGPFTILDGSGGLEIGDYCSVSSGVQIYTHDTVKWALSGGKMSYEYSPVKIGNFCYIGSLSLIEKGVTIGDHCLVGANSFVKNDVLPKSIVAGTPAKIVGKVEINDKGKIKLRYIK
ncbi:MAG: acyltransferase [Candidatus Aenigmarchaeota archaeon]|nr:acyltransferase [Candidatus Aenigmarchaeota archaeon]